MRPLIGIAAFLFILPAPAVAHGGAAGDESVISIDKGDRVDRPKDGRDGEARKPPPREKDDGERGNRREPPPRGNGDGDRAPREKGEPPVPPPEVDRGDRDYDRIWHPKRDRCPRCGLFGCTLHASYYDDHRIHADYSAAFGMYMLGSGTMMVVNLLYGIDGSRSPGSGDGAAVAGLALGGAGLLWAAVTGDPDDRTALVLTGLASIGFAALNLMSDPVAADPIVEYPRASRGLAFTLSF